MTIAENLVAKPLWQIEQTATKSKEKSYGHTGHTTYTFSDGSFMEVSKFGPRQAFLANGWATARHPA